MDADPFAPQPARESSSPVQPGAPSLCLRLHLSHGDEALQWENVAEANPRTVVLEGGGGSEHRTFMLSTVEALEAAYAGPFTLEASEYYHDRTFVCRRHLPIATFVGEIAGCPKHAGALLRARELVSAAHGWSRGGLRLALLEAFVLGTPRSASLSAISSPPEAGRPDGVAFASNAELAEALDAIEVLRGGVPWAGGTLPALVLTVRVASSAAPVQHVVMQSMGGPAPDDREMRARADCIHALAMHAPQLPLIPSMRTCEALLEGLPELNALGASRRARYTAGAPSRLASAILDDLHETAGAVAHVRYPGI
jgi:hypothetical protein